jgi:hypothetical protein
MNKAEIIAELENIVAARLFSREPWLADRETFSAVHRKLIEMGLVEQVRDETLTWQITPLGKELAPLSRAQRRRGWSCMTSSRRPNTAPYDRGLGSIG